jgi:nucleotide-binding universal stress UspA family protein
MSINSSFKFEKSDENSQAMTGIASTRTVMLALSAFKRSNGAIDMALEKASRCKRLVIVYGRNVNLGLYFMETDIGLYPKLKEKCEKKLLTEFEQQWKAKVEAIAKRARAQGIHVVTYIRTGRFTSLCLEVIEKEKPSLVVTTRPRRPAWLRNLFGSPVDYLLSHAGCPIIEV